MIVCTKCGLQNDPSDSFCGSCGSFLEWTGTKVEEAAPAPEPEPVAPEPPMAPGQPTLIGRVRDAVGLGGHAAGPAADAEATAAAEAVARRDEEAAAAEVAAAAAPVAPTAVVVTGPTVFRIVDDTPEPQPEPAPEPVAPAPAPVAPAPEPVAPAPEPAPEPEPVAPEPELVSPGLEPEPEPEPVAPAPEPVAPAPEPASEPEPVAPEPALELAPEPVAPAPEPASEPEPVAPVPESPPPAPQAMIRDMEPGDEVSATPATPAAPLPPSGEAAPDPEHDILERAPEASDAPSAGEAPSFQGVGAVPPPPSHESSPDKRHLEPGEPVAPAPAPEPTPAGPTCSACGRVNPAGRVFCISCGERLPAAAGAPPAASATGAHVLPQPPAREEPRIRPMLPGAAPSSKPRSLVQPSRPVEPPPPVPATPADLLAAPAAAALAVTAPAAPGAPPVLPAPPAAATPAQPPAQRPGPAQPPARLPSVSVAAAARASTPAAASSTPAPVGPPTPTPPVPQDQPAARRPEAVKPGPERPRPAPRSAQEATPAPNPGDLVCGNCGMGNDPARKFCRRCGQSLATATIAPTPKVPWYRRIFGGGKPRAKVAAGERPKSMRTDGKTGGGIKTGRLLSVGIQVVMLAGIIGLVAGYALVPSWRDAVNGLVNSAKEMIVPSADQVYTSGPTTGPGTKEHPARLAFDRTLAFWAAPFADGSPPTIEGSFTPPAGVAKILVTAGAAGDQYKAFARPRDVTLEFLDAAGTVIASKSYELKDQAEPQSFDVGAKGASRVRLTVRSVFPAEKPNAPVATSEVEFFGSQAGSSPTPAP